MRALVLAMPNYLYARMRRRWATLDSGWKATVAGLLTIGIVALT